MCVVTNDISIGTSIFFQLEKYIEVTEFTKEIRFLWYFEIIIEMSVFAFNFYEMLTTPSYTVVKLLKQIYVRSYL